MVSSAILFALFILVYIIIWEVFTVLFRLTGLTEEKAKFQVLSLLTNTGFTTNESEIILKSLRRRKLAQVTILFGYTFNVIIVSIIVNLFLSLNQLETFNLILSGLVFICLFIILYVIGRFGIKTKFDTFIEKFCNNIIHGKDFNTIILMDSFGEKVMASVHLNKLSKEFNGVLLKDAGLKKNYGIQILIIKRNEKIIDPIDGDSFLLEEDIIVAFGSFKNIKSAFES